MVLYIEKNKHSTFKGESIDKPITLLFIRHGEAYQEGKGLNRINGVGPDLTELGKQQAQRVARRLADYNFDHIYASDLLRARKTGEYIHIYHKNAPMTITADLREVNHLHFLQKDPPEDPDLERVMQEEKDSITRFINHIRHKHKPGEKIVVVCHGNIIRTMIPLFGGRDPASNVLMEMNNASVSILDVWLNGEAVLLLANCVKHLLATQVT